MAHDHYVPQFYLKAFTDHQSPDPRAPFLWVVDKQALSIKRKAPLNVASIAGFYDSDALLQSGGSLEALYQKIESRTAPIIRKVRAHAIHLSSRERYYLLNFIASQLARTPYARRHFTDQWSMIGHNWLRSFAADEAQIQAQIDALRLNLSAEEMPLTVEDIKSAIENNEVTMTPNRSLVLAATLGNTLGFLAHILPVHITYLHAAAGVSFVTSDHPVALFVEQSHEGRTSNEDAWRVFVPFSPTCAMLLNPHLAHDTIVTAAIDHVQSFNRLMIQTADRYLFCHTHEQATWLMEYLA